MERKEESPDAMNTGSLSTPAGFEVTESPSLTSLLHQVEAQRAEIDRQRSERPDLWPTVQEKLKFTWTYDSNAIEGSTLSLGDTIFYLKEGLTVEGKPLKDFLDARNHAEAVDLLGDVVAARRAITEGLLKEINALLLLGVRATPAINERGERIEKEARPGEYKRLPNHVLQPDGTIHRYVDPLQVPGGMAALCGWIATQEGRTHPVTVAAIAHHDLVRIHPFDDGNGRGARLLMNLILMKAGYPPAVVRNERRRQYLAALKDADSGALAPFIEFIASSLAETQAVILADLRR
ncbi:MAG: Fic family protein [Magnetospirillum sp. WYHS-4]